MSGQIPERIPGGAVDLSHLASRAAQAHAAGGGSPTGTPSDAVPGSGPTVDVPSLVIDVTEQTFEQAMQLSSVVPVVVDLWAEWCQPCKTLGPILESVTREYGGRVLLAKVDVDANPGLAQAFQAQSIPTVVALVAGRPVPLFQGAVPEQQVREVFAQLVQLAGQQGVVGRVHAAGESEEPGAPAEPPVNPAHVPALDAIEAGDYAAAVEAYEQVLLKSPGDREARAALVQVSLLHRLSGATVDEIRGAAASDPSNVDAQLRVADLDVSGGHIEDAFLRLLELFAASADADDRTRIRERLLELFEVVGSADARVVAARTRLASLLY